MTIERAPRTVRIDWLDYARALCAIAVVLFHYLSRIVTTGHMPPQGVGIIGLMAEYGYLGVDFFFMVSGFVIMMSVTDRSASEFAAARIVRLYPAFLFCMTVTAIVLAINNDPALPSSFLMWVANLPIAAPVFGIPFMDGVYWTLLYELAFYGLVFAIILFGLRKHMETIVFLWLAAEVIAFAIGWDFILFTSYYLLFTAGCLLFFALDRGMTPLRIAALIISLLLNVESAMERGAEIAITGDLATLPWVIGLLIAGFFAAFVICSSWAPSLPAAKRVGSLTYPLYLVHQQVGYVLIPALAVMIGFGPAVAIVAVGMAIFSILVARYVEEWLRPLWKRLAAIAVIPVTVVEKGVARLRPSRDAQRV